MVALAARLWLRHSNHTSAGQVRRGETHTDVQGLQDAVLGAAVHDANEQRPAAGSDNRRTQQNASGGRQGGQGAEQSV